MLPLDELGEGPAVVLLHAGVLDRSMWAELSRALAGAGHRAIAPDLPGFGEAAAPSAAPWLDVLAAMDALGVERAAIVGSSYGGAVALRVALAAPGRVSALVLASAPPPDLDPSPELARAWQAEDEALERGDPEGAIAAVVSTWTLPDAPALLRERVAAAQRRAHANAAAAGTVEQAPDPLEEDPGLLARIEAPTLALAGTRELADFRDGALRMARAMPNARAELIEGAGHLAPLETPDAFRDLVLEFLGDAAATPSPRSRT